MPNTYVQTGAGAYTEIAGTKGIFAQTGATAYTRVWQAYVQTGASTWVKVYQYDTVGPVVNANRTTTGLSNANMRFAWSGGALVTDADSGVASVKIQVQYTPWGGSGEGWTDWQTLTLAQWTATSGSFDFTPSTAKRRQWSFFTETVSRYYVGFRVVATDNVGLVTNSSEVAALTKPYGGMLIAPASGATGADSYQTSVGFYGLPSHGVRSGLGGTSLNWDYGCYFYGTQIQDATLGYAPDSASFTMQRYSSNGISGTYSFQYHDSTASTGSTNVGIGGTVQTQVVLGTDASYSVAVPSGWLAPFASGSAKGIAMVRNGNTDYHVLYSWNEQIAGSSPATYSSSGVVQLNFS